MKVHLSYGETSLAFLLNDILYSNNECVNSDH
jgi:hypothetical protein